MNAPHIALACFGCVSHGLVIHLGYIFKGHGGKEAVQDQEVVSDFLAVDVFDVVISVLDRNKVVETSDELETKRE